MINDWLHIVYFVRRANGDIKIGTTIEYQFKRRMYNIAKQHGELEFLGYVLGSVERERELHKLFAQYRRIYRVNHPRGNWLARPEWLFPAKEILDYISQNSLGKQFVPRS